MPGYCLRRASLDSFLVMHATRIGNAKFLLQNTGDPVKSICFTVGFTSESSFCTAFEKETGLTPSEYRTQVSEL